MEDFQKQFVLAMLAYASKRDVDPSHVCRLSGLDLKLIQRDAPLTISTKEMESLWKNLVAVSGDPLFGLHFGESLQLAALGVVGQIIQTSRNVGEALSTAGTLIPLVSDIFTMQPAHSRKTVWIRLTADPKKMETRPFTYKQMADCLMVFMIHELDGLLLRKVTPLNACFSYPIENEAEYNRLMRCNIRRASGLSIELHRENLDDEIISANYDLQARLLEIVQKLMQNRREDNSLSSRIFNYLISNAYLYGVSLESAAANFNMSARTLQRKLSKEGVSFQQIADEAKKKLAVSYLASGHHQVKDVAYILGYNEQSALVRAFKRWTGTTPGEFMNKSRRNVAW